MNEFRYVGEAFDPNAGFYYLRARWYSPEEGRFTSVDPSKENIYAPPSLHHYAYADLCPICKSDPTGRFAIQLVLGGASTIYQDLGSVSVPSIQPKQIPLIHFDEIGRPSLVVNNLVHAAMHGRVSRVKPPGDYFVVQWIRGSESLNGQYMRTAFYTGTGTFEDFNFPDYRIDESYDRVIYRLQEPYVPANEIWFWDYPRINKVLPFVSGDRAVFYLDFIVAVHSRKKHPNPTRAEFHAPWNPMPEASAPWYLHYEWTSP